MKSLNKYYKAFTTCEHILNKGELTPFVVEFSKIVVSSIESTLDQLKEKLGDLKVAEEKLDILLPSNKKNELEGISYALIQASLFTDNGVTTNELCDACDITAPTVVKRRKKIKDEGLLKTKKLGHYSYYSLNLEELFSR